MGCKRFYAIIIKALSVKDPGERGHVGVNYFGMNQGIGYYYGMVGVIVTFPGDFLEDVGELVSGNGRL